MRLALLSLLSVLLLPAEWMGFRGPGGNGTSSSKGLPVEWSDSTNIAWRTPIAGRGYSSPIVVAGKVCVTTSLEGAKIAGRKAPDHVLDGKPFVHPQTTADDVTVTLKAICVDAQSGKVAWERALYEGGVYDGRHIFNTFASPTPLSDGKRLFFYFESQGLYALDLTGKLLWKTSLGGIAKVGLGAGTSPVLAGGNIILQADEDNGDKSFLYGVSPANGEIVWKTKRKASVTWNTPVVARHGDRDIVITAATENVIAYDPKTGQELWTGPGIEGYAAASPVSGGGLVFPNSYHPVKKLYAMHVDPAAKERVAWKYEKGTAYVPSPIYYEGHVYLVTDGGLMSCLEAATGKLIYEGKRLPKPAKLTASPVAFDGKIFLTTQEGETYVLRAGPEHGILRTNPLGEGVFASLALDGDSIYVRGDKHLFRIRQAK
ncbi:MAG: PQQ-binding-like beta-propeller repeat protein [Acidobacteria bacterium]|nr:PQQ-binding-like beta-propeller repeat protein [Acidobacteriota bacterium]